MERGEYAQSFDHYAAGNRLRVASLTPDQMRVSSFVDAPIATFTSETFERNSGAGAEAEGPVFVRQKNRAASKRRP